MELSDCNWASKASPSVQSSFCVIYICMYMYVGLSTIVYGKPIQKNGMPKCVGGITCPKKTCMLKVSFGSLKQSADYNFRLELLIVPSSGRLKMTCDTHIINLYYTIEQL